MLAPDERGEVISHISRSIRENQSPGPAAYSIKRSLDSPETPPIPFHARHSISPDLNRAPYVQLRSSIGTATPITLHGRPRTRAPDPTPGPGYLPPAFGSGGRKIGFASPSFGLPSGTSRRRSETARSTPAVGKRRNADETPGPGPGRYLNRLKEFDGGSPGVQIKGSHDFGYGKSETPGPGAYRPRYDRVLPSAPKYGMHARTKLPEREQTPGYRDIGSTLGGLRYSMKGRADDEIVVV